MKILCILLTVASLQLAARGYSQGISLSLKDASLEKVFQLVEKQSAYSFVYSQEAMAQAKPVSIEVRNETLENVLRLCFKDQPLRYSVNGRFIIIKIPEKKNEMVKEDIDLRGKVVNENGDPLAGVTVSVKNSNLATSTDESGGFILKDVPEQAVLVVTSIGYHMEEVPVNNKTYILIPLQLLVGSLDETIVKGYYSTSKKLNTGSVSKVSAKEISQQPVTNPLAALEGRVPGLLITQQSGVPGTGFTILIRGRNSINNGTSPLYVIDGVPFLNDDDATDILTQRGVYGNRPSPFNSISPEDIESIEVLKDADATSIYGSRGANGVILITTKKAKAGKTSVTANVYYGWSRVTKAPEYMNTQQFLEMRHEAFRNDGVTPTLSNAKDLLIWDTTRYTNLNDVLIGGTARTFNTTVRMTGGNEYTRITAGANYYTESTVFPGNKTVGRGGADMGFIHTSANKKFNLNWNVSFASVDSKLMPADITQYINLPPLLPPLFDSAGHLNWRTGTANFNNPLAGTLQQYHVLTDRLTEDALLSYKIIPSLFAKLSMGYNQVWVDEQILTPITSLDPAFSPTGSSFFGKSNAKSWILEPQIEYSLSHHQHHLQVMTGMTFQEKQTSRDAISAKGYTNDELLASTSGAQTLTPTNNLVQYHYTALFGRINYNYKNKYLVNLTGRRDGSSRFGTDHRFANFGAVGAGWIFTEEKFTHLLHSILSYGKIRGSYGITGNDLINDYQYLDTYTGTQYPYQGNIGLQPSRLFNGNYSWEQIMKISIGLELGFLRNKLHVDLDWYSNRSQNQIINYTLPGQTGFTYILSNFPGVVQNRGCEISINSTNLDTKVWEWSSSFNISFSKNKLVAFPGLASSSYASQYQIGKPLNLNIGYHFLGVDPQTGLYQFEDVNKDHIFDQNDFVYNGSSDPKYYGGLSNTVRYKDFELSFLLEFRKQLGLNPFYAKADLVGEQTVSQPTALLDRWQKPGDIKPYQRYTETYGLASSAILKLIQSGATLTNASFVRLKNLSASYILNKKKGAKTGYENLRVFVMGQNLLLFTPYLAGDPETQGLTVLPPLRTITAGIQITF